MKRLKQVWFEIRIAWHTGRAIYHDNKVEELMLSTGTCPECGGRENKHYLSCSVWIHNRQIKNI